MLNHKGTNTMKTERLTLRPMIESDAQAYFTKLVNDKEVLRYTAWPYHEKVEQTEEMVKNWIKNYTKPMLYNWAVALDDDLIGTFTVYRIYEDECAMEIGYCFGKDHWNKGYATEAAKAVVEYLIKEIGAKKVVISYADKNPASGRVAQKCGFQYVKTEENAFTTRDGEVTNVIEYELIV